MIKFLLLASLLVIWTLASLLFYIIKPMIHMDESSSPIKAVLWSIFFIPPRALGWLLGKGK